MRDSHHKNSAALTEYYEFDGRDPWTCAAPGWEAVADHALDWAIGQLQAARAAPGSTVTRPAAQPLGASCA